MTIANYTDLKNAVISHLDRSDLGPHINTLVALGESKVNLDVRTQSMVARTAVTVANRFIDLPARFTEMITFRLITSPVKILNPLSVVELSRRRVEASGSPLYYAIHEQIELDVIPDSSISGEFIYYRSFEPLSDASPTNALLTQTPGVYLYAALSAAAPFLMNDERLTTWGTLYQSFVDSLNGRERRKIQGSPLVPRVVGGVA